MKSLDIERLRQRLWCVVARVENELTLCYQDA
jgi:hypothetical protein